MTPQEKLNKIDELLFKADFAEPTTIAKVEAIIHTHKRYKRELEHKDDMAERAIDILQGG